MRYSVLAMWRLRNGKKVLLVDADPQGHLSTGLGIAKTTKVTLKTMMEYVFFAYDKNNPGALGYDWLAKEVIKNG